MDPNRPVTPRKNGWRSWSAIARATSLLAVVFLTVAACGRSAVSPATSATVEPVGASAVASVAPAAGESTTPSVAHPSPTADPMTNPSIKGSFAVGDGPRKLALVCWGSASPTVLLETGGPNIEQWSASGIVRALVGQMRVCTYDRAGTGESDLPPYERRDADDVVSDLKALLAAAKVEGPYVLLGRSFGGMVVAHFAETEPDDVVGVIILDTPAPSATFTPESEPGLVWDFPDNTERLDVVGGFENRFAKAPPKVDVPVLLITPIPGEASAQDESFWLRISARSRQVELGCDNSPLGGPCADAILDFVQPLG